MNEVTLSDRVAEINRLHGEILGAVKVTLEKAIRIGELLTQQKEECKRGKWLSWLRQNVKFSQPTASRYMRCYDKREQLKLINVNSLRDAYYELFSRSQEDEEQFEEMKKTNLAWIEQEGREIIQISTDIVYPGVPNRSGHRNARIRSLVDRGSVEIKDESSDSAQFSDINGFRAEVQKMLDGLPTVIRAYGQRIVKTRLKGVAMAVLEEMFADTDEEKRAKEIASEVAQDVA